MAAYPFAKIESKWQRHWAAKGTYATAHASKKPKYYILSMFPYPSGAGLHVGHPLGYIAADILARFQRMRGFEVLHPMGFDAFGLPAEQYAIQTGAHPADTTRINMERYQKQLQAMGLSYDWSRKICTSSPDYYRWTQWIFIQLFHSWYNKQTDKAESIDQLIARFERNGNAHLQAVCDEHTPTFTAADWKAASQAQQAQWLAHYRLTYLSDVEVNWCPALGTVLSNDEVKDGYSERGGHPVELKKMKQWMMRITAYADRLLAGLAPLDWPHSVKEMQRHWIGKSVGLEIQFQLKNASLRLSAFTTRPDTLYGVSFIALSPEHSFLDDIVTEAQAAAVSAFVAKARKQVVQSTPPAIRGVFTGAYALHPLTQRLIPIWVANYILEGYGTGVVMGVPAHDERDFQFATTYDLPIPSVIRPATETNADGPYTDAVGVLVNSGPYDGQRIDEATRALCADAEANGWGQRRTHYRLRDAIFGRQRYWGEPIPVYFKNDIPYPLAENELPLTLPQVDAYLPTDTGAPPLARATQWTTQQGHPYEYTTMPGWAGSSWYFFRYMDPHNTQAFCAKKAQAYWRKVDVYVGGSEHAVGHLLYARFWTKFLYDRGYVTEDEFADRLVNQGMIQGQSAFMYRVQKENKYVSRGLRHRYATTALHVDVRWVKGNGELDLNALFAHQPALKNAEFELENGRYLCGREVEKMSKSKHNVINPDDILRSYGADTFRLYEMFLGPIEQSKPWDTQGIEGLHRFLNKVWQLFYVEGKWAVTDEAPSEALQKHLHQTIKKVGEDTSRMAFNTAISALMVLVNALRSKRCRSREVLHPLTLMLAPYAPHIAEELWEGLGHRQSVSIAPFPEYKAQYLQKEEVEYPVCINGKRRLSLNYPSSANEADIKSDVLQHKAVQRWIGDKHNLRVVFVPGRMINIVVPR